MPASYCELGSSHVLSNDMSNYQRRRGRVLAEIREFSHGLHSLNRLFLNRHSALAEITLSSGHNMQFEMHWKVCN